MPRYTYPLFPQAETFKKALPGIIGRAAIAEGLTAAGLAIKSTDTVKQVFSFVGNVFGAFNQEENGISIGLGATLGFVLLAGITTTLWAAFGINTKHTGTTEWEELLQEAAEDNNIENSDNLDTSSTPIGIPQQSQNPSTSYWLSSFGTPDALLVPVAVRVAPSAVGDRANLNSSYTEMSPRKWTKNTNEPFR